VDIEDEGLSDGQLDLVGDGFFKTLANHFDAVNAGLEQRHLVAAVFPGGNRLGEPARWIGNCNCSGRNNGAGRIEDSPFQGCRRDVDLSVKCYCEDERNERQKQNTENFLRHRVPLSSKSHSGRQQLARSVENGGSWKLVS